MAIISVSTSESNLPESTAVMAFHDECLRVSGWAKIGVVKRRQELWQMIEANHRCNCLLWEEEDLARRRNVPDSEISENKRAIDAHNQKRNDVVEQIDEALLGELAGVERQSGARLHSETAGSMIDRLSILALKIHYMRLQTLRIDVDDQHVASCSARLALLLEQRDDLAGCLNQLLAEAARGETWFKVYRQFKMYNDPNLNPAIHGEKR